MVLIHTDDLVRGSGIKETSNFSLEVYGHKMLLVAWEIVPQFEDNLLSLFGKNTSILSV